MEHYIYGCARTSMQLQELIRQLDLLKKYKCTEIVIEKMAGTK